MSQKPDAQEQPVLDDILKKFPFHRQTSQKQKLAKYLKSAPGNGVYGIADQTGISPTTVRKIRDSYTKLTPQEKSVFLNELASETANDNS